MSVTIRYRDDATGLVAKYAGQVCGTHDSRKEAEEIVRQCPNGAQMTIEDQQEGVA